MTEQEGNSQREGKERGEKCGRQTPHAGNKAARW